MKVFDVEGHLTHGPGGIWVVNPQPENGTILIPDAAIQYAWGGEDRTTLFFTVRRRSTHFAFKSPASRSLEAPSKQPTRG